MTNLGKNLQNLRKIKGYNQSQLGDLLDVNFKNISDWERGKTTPDLDIILKITEIFGINIDFLVNNNDEITHLITNLDESKNSIKSPPKYPPNHPPNQIGVQDAEVFYNNKDGDEVNPLLLVIDTQSKLIDSLNTTIQLLQDKIKTYEK